MRPSLLLRPCETGAAMLRMRAHGQQILRGRLDIVARVRLVKIGPTCKIAGTRDYTSILWHEWVER
jgi:hypothetical protein